MRRAHVGLGLVLGALTSLPLAALLVLAHAATGSPFLPFDVFEWLSRLMPGGVLTVAIDLVVSIVTALRLPTAAAAKAAEMGLALALFVAGSAALGGLVALARRGAPTRFAGLAAAAAWTIAALASERALGAASLGGMLWLAGALTVWGLGLAEAIDRARLDVHAPPEAKRARRRFLAGLAGTLVTSSGVLAALAALFRRSTSGTGAASSTHVMSATLAAGRPLPVAGTRAELTPNDRFYRIDIDLEPPRIDAAAWRLHVDGLVTSPRDFSLDEIRALPAVSQVITLECISNRVGGDLISTSRWTGVRLRDFLQLVGASDRARAVHMKAADGFYESVGIDDARDERTLLVHTMNGVPLPAKHGFPLRIYVPNRYGMKQPKWLTHLRVSDEQGHGYWVDRGWSEQAIVNTTSVIDAVAPPTTTSGAKVVPVGGIAYAGARGIRRVEVQVDDGPWREATLIAPPLGALSWVLWRYEWPYVPGRHTFRVRAFDGTDALQPTRVRPPHPSGATGIDARTTTV